MEGRQGERNNKESRRRSWFRQSPRRSRQNFFRVERETRFSQRGRNSIPTPASFAPTWGSDSFRSLGMPTGYGDCLIEVFQVRSLLLGDFCRTQLWRESLMPVVPAQPPTRWQECQDVHVLQAVSIATLAAP